LFLKEKSSDSVDAYIFFTAIIRLNFSALIVENKIEKSITISNLFELFILNSRLFGIEIVNKFLRIFFIKV
jgi:hypothetical protein